MDRNNVVLVDRNDNPLGVMEKISAHQKGHLHRAFSIFVFNDNSEFLLQQRAEHKYHGAGLWSNTCCSHPQWGEAVDLSADERLKFEMGMECELKLIYSFIYHEEVENDLIEHELDYVFIGHSNENPIINEDEVQDYKWMSVSEILTDLESNPTKYTVWFRQAFPDLISKMKN